MRPNRYLDRRCVVLACARRVEALLRRRRRRSGCCTPRLRRTLLACSRAHLRRRLRSLSQPAASLWTTISLRCEYDALSAAQRCATAGRSVTPVWCGKQERF